MLNRTGIRNFCSLLGSLFPKVLCNGILAWSYYELLLITKEFDLNHLARAIDFIGLVLVSLCIWTYFLIIRVGAGSPLDFPELLIPYEALENPLVNADDTDDELPNRRNNMANLDPPVEYVDMKTSRPGSYRFCNKCHAWKPDRTHHCLQLGKCILKMDHYCPWFSSCVGYRNHKFFVQELMYISVYAWFVFWVCFAVLYKVFLSENIEAEHLTIGLLVLTIVALVFGICVTVFWGFSVYLVLINQTTIEFQDKRTGYTDGEFRYEFDSQGKKKLVGNIWDLGKRRNWEQVMGKYLYQWMLPVSITSTLIRDTHNNGLNFEVNEDVYAKWQSNVAMQEQLNQQLMDYRDRRISAREA